MAEKKDAHDEKLIEELYERLWWYTHEATDEEFDEKEVDAITRLLDILEPVYDDPVYAGGPAAALQRFRERYGETETDAPSAGGDLRAMDTAAAAASSSATAADEERAVDAEPAAAEESAAAVVSAAAASVEHAASEEPAAAVPAPAVVSAAGTVSGKHGRKASGRRRGGWRRIAVRIGIGLAACLVLLVTVNVGCYAIKEKSFFEIVREGVGRTEITVTGNVGEDFEISANEAMKCSSWDEVEKLVGEDIDVPKDIPQTYKLESLEVQSSELSKTVVAWYRDEEDHFLRIHIKVYQENFTKDIVMYEKEWTMISEKDGIQFYTNNEAYIALFSKDRSMYYILNNDTLDNLEKIVAGIIE